MTAARPGSDISNYSAHAMYPLAESVIGKQYRKTVASCRYDASLFVRDMRAGVESATGTAMVGCGRSSSGAAAGSRALRRPGLLVKLATLRRSPRC